MRSRMLLATCALILGSLVALPAVAGSSRPAAECPAGTFLAKYEVESTIRFSEGTDVVSLTVTSTKGRGEVMGFAWTSSTPISQVVVKAGRTSTTVAVAGAATGTFAVPGRNAVSHITFCRGAAPPPPVDTPPPPPPVDTPPPPPPVDTPPPPPPVDTPPPPPPVDTPPPVQVTASGKALLGCWRAEADGTYSVEFAYLNTSTDAAGSAVAVDRTIAGFGTSYPTLADQFPTQFLPTGSRDRDATYFTVSGWDGVSNLTFQLFGTSKTMKADPSWSMPSNECF